ncbi:N-acetylneuraminate synthase [Trichococcus flocculiformis]|uniref:N-acetylneuraminate synthase n=1 Tax=Trichococcus TaxID=82802 RepID=UPI0007A8E2BD|nr:MULTISPECIES: N-acetylneuraminate synthase [Trichococcus]CZR10831.1 aldolase-type tim barrel [Trichococcus sp. ES5]SHG27327.1 N-acetylneuraminate synthase [Trichococcus flocculiformis]
MGKVFIIAEAGVNHNGDMEIAKKLIEEGAKAGVDAVKFQTFKAETLVAKSAKKAEYQKNTTDQEESQYEMLKKLELDYGVHEELMSYAKDKGVMFLSSAFDLESIDLLVELGLDLFKIPSGEITNLPYLRKIAQTNKKVVLSTGMSTLGDIEKALEVLRENGASDIVVLHCNTEYPTPMEDVNLKAMNGIRNAFQVEVGYSDHTLGIEIPTAAVALGATMIEKHFTLDKTMEGPDHKASLEPDELKAMVKAIRNLEVALGDGVKRLSNSEKKNMAIARKSLVAKVDIAEGEVFSEDNLTIKRPGTGLSPMEWDYVMGLPARRAYQADEVITL